MEHMQRVWLASRERLPFRTPGPVPHSGLANAPIVETKFLELAMSLLDFSPRIPLGTFSILLDRLARAVFWVFRLVQKHKIVRRHRVLASYKVISNSVRKFQRSRKCLSQSEARVVFLLASKTQT